MPKATRRPRPAAPVPLPAPLPTHLMETLRAYQQSRTILTGVELDVFTALGRGATAGTVARRIRSDRRGTEILLNALTALGLLRKRAGVFTNGATAAAFLGKGAPYDARMAILHTANQWRRWSEMTDCVRRGRPAKLPPMARRGTDWRDPFIAAMHANASARAPSLVAALDLVGARTVLDVGGGSGAYAIAIARAHPGVRAVVLDLPNVTPLTRRYIDESGVAARIDTRDGDYLRDGFGVGYDLVLFSAVMHINTPAENRLLLKKARAALNPGGRVAIHDSIMDDDKTKPASGALFALNMLVSTPGGNSYSRAEYAAWMRGAGFVKVRKVPLPGPSDLMLGTT